MASFEVAFDWLMDSEDPRRECEIVPDAPPGASAVSGINSFSFPTSFQRITDLPQGQRLSAVALFYKTYFWTPSGLPKINSDELAKRVFDASVNMGSQTAVKLLQACLWPSQEPDGIWGPETVNATNAAVPALLASAFRKARSQHYLDIVQHNPNDAKYLSGWLVRAGR
jgi:lysozyme family protein